LKLNSKTASACSTACSTAYLTAYLTAYSTTSSTASSAMERPARKKRTPHREPTSMAIKATEVVVVADDTTSTAIATPQIDPALLNIDIPPSSHLLPFPTTPLTILSSLQPAHNIHRLKAAILYKKRYHYYAPL